jgi:hypothetical protein
MTDAGNEDAENEVAGELVSATGTQSETETAGAGWEWDHGDEKVCAVDLEEEDLWNQIESFGVGNLDY